MEENNNNPEKPKLKANTFKMQDLFAIYDKDKLNLKNKEDQKNNLNQNDLDLQKETSSRKNFLYKSIYESTILYVNNEINKDDKDDKDDKDNKDEKDNKDKNDDIKEKPKVTLQRKNNLLNYRKNSNSDELSYIEPIGIFIDDINRRPSELIMQNFECKFIFDEKVHYEFIYLVHFSPKYFEFPVYYALKGSFDESAKTTTITLKDYRSFKISSLNNNIYNKLFNQPKDKKDFYKYALFYKTQQDKNNINYKIDGWNLYDPVCEYLRQGVEFSDTKFCFSNLNNNYGICETYPYLLVIPKKFDNDGLSQIAKSRIKNRFPLLSYHYHNKNSKNAKNKISCYLYRSAQINKGGVIFKSKNLEVEYMNHIGNMDNKGKGFIIFDCRPELNAKVNAFKGAGTDDISIYKNCKELIFGYIENIHCVRQALKKALQKAYYGNEDIVKGKVFFDIKNSNMTNFLSKFENTKWLNYLSDLLLGSVLVAKKLFLNINVLVHCSDGWDRTAQICSLVQIILDPYFRTIEGFAVLVEKEWISLGHQFATRNGCNMEKKGERSPIFIQFLHAVYQMIIQYPTAFEFNSYFLLFLSEEIYSNKYGTFLFDCEKEKFINNAPMTMVSIWSDILNEKNKYINDLYKPINKALNIKGEIQYLSIWNDFFFKYDKIGMTYINQSLYDRNDFINKVQEEKNANILELLKVIKNNGLENLIKDNKIYKMFKDDLNKNG